MDEDVFKQINYNDLMKFVKDNGVPVQKKLKPCPVDLTVLKKWTQHLLDKRTDDLPQDLSCPKKCVEEVVNIVQDLSPDKYSVVDLVNSDNDNLSDIINYKPLDLMDVTADEGIQTDSISSQDVCSQTEILVSSQYCQTERSETNHKSIQTIARSEHCHDVIVDENSEASLDILTGPGTRSYRVTSYQDQILYISKKLTEVAQVTVRMEQSGASCMENDIFATLIKECGEHMVTYGNKL